MTVVAIRPAPISYEEALQTLREYMFRHRVHASAAVDALLPSMQLDEEALSRVIRAGLITDLNADQGNARRGDQAARDRWLLRQLPTRPPLYAEDLAILNMRLDSADGRPKPIHSFTANDLLHFEEICRNKARGWLMRGQALKRIRATLVSFDADTINDLSPKHRADVANELANAWERDH